jgi:hypothetical protein
MAAETAKATEPCKIEVRFHAPVHLLALFEEGERSNGFTCVEGLPRSALRNYRRNFVPSGHGYYDLQEPPPSPAPPTSISIRRCCCLNPELGKLTFRSSPGCFSKMRGYGTSRSS